MLHGHLWNFLHSTQNILQLGCNPANSVFSSATPGSTLDSSDCSQCIRFAWDVFVTKNLSNIIARGKADTICFWTVWLKATWLWFYVICVVDLPRTLPRLAVQCIRFAWVTKNVIARGKVETMCSTASSMRAYTQEQNFVNNFSGSKPLATVLERDHRQPLWGELWVVHPQ
jgi:hypothetical protein